MKRVSEVVTIDEIKSWGKGDIITIEAGTGHGKSYFIKNNLYALAKKDNKKILMLIHRTNCVNQFQMEIERDNKTDTIEIMTYQKLEYIYRKNKGFNFSTYQYIVCDEFHYFMNDAAFNNTTDISLNLLLNQNDAIRIFMSATGNYMKQYIKGYRKIDTIDYNLPINFDFIKTLSFYNKDASLNKFIETAIEKKMKSIFFIESATKAYELYSKYKDHCLFNCSKQNQNDLYKHVDQDRINDMLINERFEETILITTTCLDAGVNIVDKELTHIVCDVRDTGTLIQCIGRKRLIDKDDHINLTIKTISNQSLGGRQTKISKKLNMAQYLREHTVQEYTEKYFREYDRDQIVYDDILEGEPDKTTKKVNELIYFKLKIDVAEMDIMKRNEKFGYNKYIASKLGFYDHSDNTYDYIVIEESDKKMELEEYLDSIVSVRLHKNEQKTIINKIDLRVNGRQQKSYKKLNEGLEMIGLPFIIIPKRTNDERYWIVEKMER